MATKNSNYSILVDVELITSGIQKQLNNAAKNTKISIDTKDAQSNVRGLSQDVGDLGLTFQEANLIMNQSIEIIASMVEQVFELDTAMTEFKKVSELSGSALDKYVSKLSSMGNAVARTGKPKCLSRGVGMVNQHQELFKIQ